MHAGIGPIRIRGSTILGVTLVTGVPIPAPKRPTPIDQPLWRLVKAERIAIAVTRRYLEIPDGLELRVSVDDSMRWSRMYRGPGLESQAADLRRAFERLGWLADL
jgi:hypothetical protein